MSSLQQLIQSRVAYSARTKKVAIITATKASDDITLYQVRDENGAVYCNVEGTEGLTKEATLAFIDGDTARPYLIGMTISKPTKIVLGRADIRLDWEDNSDNEDGFIVERKKGKYGAWVSIATMPAGAITVTVYNILLDDDYHFRVKAFNAVGESGYSNITTVGKIK